MSLRPLALQALCLADPEAKAETTHDLHARVEAGALAIDPAERLTEPAPPLRLPGRPERPRLVEPAEVPRRSPFSAAGRAALLHAVCHIEFNAINLALDAVWRFPDLPADYYRDWLQVAAEEATHFRLLRAHLRTLGCDYGDHEAHDGLWRMTEATREDFIARMALVPRTLEARGLDATPPMQARLRQAGDLAAVAILDIILRDEVGHVAIGNHWYRWACERAGLDPVTLYPQLVERYRAPRAKPPFNLEARRRAGFSAQELDALG